MKIRGNSTGLILQKGTRIDADEDGLFTMTRKFACLKSAFPALRGNFETDTDDDALSTIANGYTPSYPSMSITDWSSVDDGPKTYIDAIFKGTIDALRDPKWSQTGKIELVGASVNPWKDGSLSNVALSLRGSSTIITARYWSDQSIDEPQFQDQVLPFIAAPSTDVTDEVADLTLTITNTTVLSLDVSGAGTTTSNGTFIRKGYLNGRAKWVKDGEETTYIGWSPVYSVWFLFDTTAGANTYKTSNSPLKPQAGTWIAAPAGTAPAPTVAPTLATAPQRAILTLEQMNRYYFNATGAFSATLVARLKNKEVVSTPVGKLFRVVESYYAYAGTMGPLAYATAATPEAGVFTSVTGP